MLNMTRRDLLKALSAAGIYGAVPFLPSRLLFAAEPQKQPILIVLHLRGQVGAVPVVKPITVKARPQCSSCGKVNKAGTEFCGKCGTALVVYA